MKETSLALFRQFAVARVAFALALFNFLAVVAF
jgi:hypothetical protein